MRQSLDDGTFWFAQLMQEAFNFDEEILWRNLERAVQERGLLEVGVPSEEGIEKFVETKLMETAETSSQSLLCLRLCNNRFVCIDCLVTSIPESTSDDLSVSSTPIVMA